jgi:CRP/FNR family transcriptional regulator, cyclic AMP receptor protein
MKTPDDVLTTTDLLYGLNEEEATTLIALGERRKYHRNDIITESGKRERELYIILRGQVEVIKKEGTSEKVLVVLGTGQGFGEMAILDAGPRSATIRCVSDKAYLLCIPGEALLAFCRRTPSVGYQLMYNLARDLAFKLRHRNLPRTSSTEVST